MGNTQRGRISGAEGRNNFFLLLFFFHFRDSVEWRRYLRCRNQFRSTCPLCPQPLSLSLLMYSIPNDSRLPLGCVCVCWPLRTTVSLYNFFVPPSPVMDLNSWPFSSSSWWMVDEARHYDMCRPCRCRCTQHLLRFRRVE